LQFYSLVSFTVSILVIVEISIFGCQCVLSIFFIQNDIIIYIDTSRNIYEISIICHHTKNIIKNNKSTKGIHR